MMRENARIKRMLLKLEKLWNRYPDMRLGQLLENYIYYHGKRGDATSEKLFYQDDKYTEETIDRELKNINR